MIIASSWLSDEPATLPTGTDFDAVRLAQRHGQAAISHLKNFGVESRIGPIVADHDQWYVLLEAGSNDEPWPDIVHYCGEGSTVTLPPPQSTASDPAGLRWIRSLQDAGERWFSDSMTLRTVLEVVAANRPTAQM
jgi:hypothetical protein